MILRDFKCSNPECEHEFETLTDADSETEECPNCGSRAQSQLSPVHLKDVG